MSLMVSYHTAKSDYFDGKQKVMIIIISWLIPIIGPAFILSILINEKSLVKKPSIPLLHFIFLGSVINSSQKTSNESIDSNGNENYIGDSSGSDT
jgi:hypothetical protein